MTAPIDHRPDPHAHPGTVRHAAVFLPLFAPFGISSGYVSVTLAFLLGRAGLPTFSIATIIAATLWVQTWKVLWAPIVDTVGDPKWWYGLGAAGVGATILTMSVLPATALEVSTLTVLAVVSSAASTLVSMSSEIFLAQCVPPESRGRASGWSQAGNLGGAGVGGGLGLLLAQHVAQPWVAGAVLAAICCACWGVVRMVPKARRTHATTSYVDELRSVARDVWDVARSRTGYLALILMLMPVASGAVPWSAIAGEWGAEADLVALVNGVVGGLASAIGALVGGYGATASARRARTACSASSRARSPSRWPGARARRPRSSSSRSAIRPRSDAATRPIRRSCSTRSERGPRRPTST